MAIVSYGAYILLNGIIAPKMATIIALLIAVITYVIAVFIFKVFSEEDILMLPAGNKIYSILLKLRIYKQK